jgi:hypothetical protein
MKYIPPTFSSTIQISMLLMVIMIGVAIPRVLFAASVSASISNTVSVGDTAIIDIFLDTEGEEINSLDGSLVLKNEQGGDVMVTNLSLAGSVFSMWPRSPSLRDGRTIDFVGGVPGGVHGKDLLLFSVVVRVMVPGDLIVEPSALTAYLNDGEGTGRLVTESASRISIGANAATPRDAWRDRIARDNTPPESFTVQLLQDDLLFDGMKFLHFETTDTQSGIAYYEVQESGHEKVRSGTSYVLINQGDDSTAIVTAYDVAGNARSISFPEKNVLSVWARNAFLIIVCILLLLIIRRFRMRKKNVA